MPGQHGQDSTVLRKEQAPAHSMPACSIHTPKQYSKSTRVVLFVTARS
jgi:hypothetical protein